MLKNFDSIKFKMAVCRSLFISHGQYLVSRARWLDLYYKTKCGFSGEDAPWNFFHSIQFKMADNLPLLTSTSLISVNRAR